MRTEQLTKCSEPSEAEGEFGRPFGLILLFYITDHSKAVLLICFSLFACFGISFCTYFTFCCLGDF